MKRETPSILYVTHHGGIGGAELSLLDLIRSLRGAVRATLAVPTPSPVARAASQLGVPVLDLPMFRLSRRLRSVRYLRRWFEVNRRLARLVDSHNIDIVHMNSTMAQIWGWRALAQTKIPFVWHWRDFYSGSRIHRWLDLPGGVHIAISQGVVEHAKRNLRPRSPIVKISNGFPPLPAPSEDDVQRLRADLALASDSFVVLSGGQAIPRKGFPFLLEVVSKLQTQLRTLVVVLALQTHDGVMSSYASEIESLSASRSDRVRVVRNASRRDMRSLLELASVVACPSTAEPFGRMVVEAMLAQRPVVGSAVDAHVESIIHGETGFLLSLDRADEWVRTFEFLAKSPAKRIELGQAGFERARAHFGLERAAGLMIDTYRRLLGHAERSP